MNPTAPSNWQYRALNCPGEVAALRLDGVDWQAATLTVDQRKTRSTLVLPLAAQTLELLRRYLEVGRADSDLPQLFLRIRSPIRAMSHYGIIDIL
jgi:integrase